MCRCGNGTSDGPGNGEFVEDVQFTDNQENKDESLTDEIYNDFKSKRAMFWISVLTLVVGVISVVRG